MSERYTSIEVDGDTVTWPSCNQETCELEWKYRYMPDKIDRGDEFVTASIISSYARLIKLTNKQRNDICNKLKSR